MLTIRIPGIVSLVVNSLQAFEAEGRALVQVLRLSSEVDFTRVTNCPPWTLSELVVHMAGSIRLGEFVDALPDAGLKAVADYYRRPERDSIEYRSDNVRQTQEAAGRLLATRAATDCFLEVFGATCERLAGMDLQRSVMINGVGPMSLGDWLTTRVIALAAHGLDVAITLNRPAWTTAEAHRIMRPVFAALLAADPPSIWDDHRLLSAATGRIPLTEADLSALGPQARRFPLLS